MADDLEIALRVQAKFDEARKALQDLTDDVQALGAAGKAASEPEPATSQLAETAPQATDAVKQTTAATKEHTEANKALAQAEKEQAEAADRATKAEKDLGKEQETQTQQSHKNEEQQQRQAKGSDDAAAAAAREKAAVDQLIASLDPAATAAQRLAAAQASLDAALAKGQITQEQYTQRLAQVRQQLNDVVPATEKEKAALDRLIASLDPATAAAQRMAAAQAALDSALAKGLITQDQYTRYLAQAQKQLGGLGVSAGQTAAAMRQLPAQITDITTSLASGMPVWLVAIQQGGQIKDSFGGIGPAISAMLSLITPAKAAIGGLTLGVGALAAIFLHAERRAFALGVAIQTTGNAAGATQGRIEDIAEAANKTSGISKSLAESAAVSMVQTGRLGIEVIGNLTKSVNGYAAATGQSVESASTALAKLFADPVKAAKELDDQFNFLSVAQRRHIADLVEQGRTEQAQLELSRLTADHLGRVVPENLGYLQKALNVTAEVWRNFWRVVANVGKEKTPEDLINEQEARVTQMAADLRRRGTNLAGNQQLVQQFQAETDTLSGMYRERDAKNKAADDAAAKAAEKRRTNAVKSQYKAVKDALRSEEQKLADDKETWARWRKDGDITQGELNELIRMADEKAKKKPHIDKANTPEQEAIQQIRSNLRALQAAIKSSDALLVNQLEEGRISISEAYAQRLEGINDDIDAQREALEKELNAKGTTKTRKVEIRAALKVLEQSKTDATRDLDKWRRAEELKLANIVVRLRIDTAALTGQFDREAIRKQLELQYAGDLQAAGRQADPQKAEEARKQVQLLIDAGAAQAEFNNRLAEAQRLQGQLGVIEQALQTQASQGQISQIDAEARIKQARAAQVPLLQDIVTELERVRDSLPPEAAVALDNMSTSIAQLKNEVSAATPAVVDLGKRLQNTVVDGLADAAATAVTNFKSLGEMASATLRQIAADIVRSDIKRLLTHALTPDVKGGGTLIGGIFGGIGKLFGFVEGGQIRGPGTGTSDSIAALVDGRRPIAVSNGEFIHPTRAVQHYGLPFMEAVRTLRLPRPQFAFGGLVAESRRVRFATGGAVSSTSAAEPGQQMSMPQIEIRFNNQGTPKQQAGEPKITREFGRMVIDVAIADAANGGRGIRAIKAALDRN